MCRLLFFLFFLFFFFFFFFCGFVFLVLLECTLSHSCTKCVVSFDDFNAAFFFFFHYHTHAVLFWQVSKSRLSFVVMFKPKWAKLIKNGDLKALKVLSFDPNDTWVRFSLFWFGKSSLHSE
jgi:hypothetical protein